MHVFFELEDTLGMAIDKKDGRTWLSFDDNNPAIQTLITYLNLWYNKKKQLGLAQDDSYRLMKSRFITETQQYLHSKESEIENYYAEEVQNVPGYSVSREVRQEHSRHAAQEGHLDREDWTLFLLQNVDEVERQVSPRVLSRLRILGFHLSISRL
jgi:hypothetical protein